jgi:hypothetical protein
MEESNQKEDPYKADQDPVGLDAGITTHHREFLLGRYGTVDLDPIPAADEADPHNWHVWKVRTRFTDHFNSY